MIKGETYTVHIGNNLDILPTLEDNSVDSIVTDPPYELGFMGKKWDSSGIAYSVELWKECLRVLKPGGHLLSFGGTRTWHRVAVAIEDAGFEVRDSIAWMYGSGFPKSLDISKAIDKAAGAEREVIGTAKKTPINENGLTMSGGVGKAEFDITAPSTPEAQQWEGWGTALKPAFEPIVVARKPLGGEIFVRARIENELKKLGVESISWTSSASGVKQSSQKLTSSSIKRPKTAETFASSVSVREPESTELKIQTSIEQLPSDSTLLIQADDESLPKNQKPNSKSKSLKPMAQTVNAAENQNEPSSHLITSMEVGQSIEEEPLAKSGTNLEGSDSQMVIESFAGIATGLSGSQATVHIQKLSNGEFLWPEGLPEVYKVGNTVAENVLTHGTGALNIDDSRIKGITDKELNWTPQRQHATNPLNIGGAKSGDVVSMYKEAGRWPANVILDPYTAELLDEQSDASRFFYVAKASKRDRNEGLEELEATTANAMVDREDGSAGMNSPRAGAGRTSGAKNFHPTVKPTALMRYLVKLVTPPGGTVLDPFTGSG